MIDKVKNIIKTSFYSVFTWFVLTKSAIAAGESGNTVSITEKSAEEASNKVIEVVGEALMPIGTVIIFITVAVCAFKIITTANKPEERARAIGALPYIMGGGILLGGAALATGLAIYLGNKMQ